MNRQLLLLRDVVLCRIIQQMTNATTARADPTRRLAIVLWECNVYMYVCTDLLCTVPTHRSMRFAFRLKVQDRKADTRRVSALVGKPYVALASYYATS